MLENLNEVFQIAWLVDQGGEEGLVSLRTGVGQQDEGLESEE